MNLGKIITGAFALITIAGCNNTAPKNHAQSSASDKDSAGLQPKLEEVFADSLYQLTGVTITKDNRLFTNYPYWLDTHKYSVVEVVNGKAVPYPDSAWNSFKKGDDGQNKFVCVQSVVADDKGFLWAVDPAGIGLGKIYEHSNKVVKINLANNKVERIYSFPGNEIPDNSYINDIRIDNESGFVYMTSSTNGGIVVLNTKTGAFRFVLTKSPSVISDTSYHFSPLGTRLLKDDGTPAQTNSDGIALTPDRQWLYYKPLTDNKLYRIKTSLLQDFKTSEETLDNSVEDLGKFTTTDGMIFDKNGNLYLGDIEQNRIVKITPDLKMQTFVKDDKNLLWPDTYSISDDGYLYISASQIQYGPRFHQGKDEFKRPFKIFRIKL